MIRIEGMLTTEDNRKHIPLYFDVPDGITQIHIRGDFSPKHTAGQPYPQQISLTVFDPEGPRSEYSKIREEGIIISANYATPGTTPGPIQPGRWILFINAHRIMPPDPVQYHIEISLSSEPPNERPQIWPRGHTSARGAGWYRGDLHTHSVHSDGQFDIPNLAQFARGQGWDFLVLSDHNTISGLPQHYSQASDELLTMGGIELSTMYGHALALGVREWFDWRTTTGEMLAMGELAQQVLDSGGLFVIAHPMDEGDPVCCGCRWEHGDMMPGIASAVEVWNYYWAERNEQALQLFYQWLNEGHPLVATSGTDLHERNPEHMRTAFNVVYAQELSEAAILDGIRRGHLYISAGPELTFKGRTASGVEGIMGDTIPNEHSSVRVCWGQGHEGDLLRLVVDGQPHDERIVGPSGEISWSLESGQAMWCTVELRDPQNGLWAVTNPLFFDNT